MPWQDRLKEAAYTTPSGVRLKFIYENVSRAFDKKTAAYNFPDADGTFVQDNGRTGRQIPLRLFFTGDDNDLEAQVFEDGLAERGVGRLEHPLYGVVDVVPFGKITRRDELKTGANQAIIEVTFWETIDILFPTSQEDAQSTILTSIEDFNATASGQFKENLDIDSVTEEVTLKNKYIAVLDVAQSGLQSIADINADIKKIFDATFDSINNGIDILIKDPLTLAFQTTILLQTPARETSNITARLEAYGNLANSIIAGGVRTPSLDSENANAFVNDDLFVSASITGAVASVVNNQFETKTGALSAADALLNLMDSFVEWHDENFESLNLIDTGSSYQQLQDAVALTAGFLVQISFSLQQEKTIVLNRARTIVDLAAELYGEVDSRLDFLMSSNGLVGDDILELKEGTRITYFV